MKFDGTYCRVGVPPAADQSFSYNWMPLIFGQRKIAGSIVTGTERMRLMFQMVADNWESSRHLQDAEGWTVQVIPFSGVNDASEKLKTQSHSGYRYILEW